MAETAIEWTERTWNPTTGCDKISPGCDNCYALKLAKRLKGMGSAKYQTDGDPVTSGPGFGFATHPGSINEPRAWPASIIFVNSMSDLFHEASPVDFIGGVWDTMAATPQHTYQILTKRPARARTILNRWARNDWTFRRHDTLWCGPLAGPLRNVWMGASIESDDHTVRAHHLRNTPAAVRFISAEPLLGPLPSLDLTGIDWLIAGGESGPGARPVDPGWVRDLRDRCVEAGTAFFFKQWGGRTPKAGGRELDGRTWDEYPTSARAVAA
jgi:protein gp37